MNKKLISFLSNHLIKFCYIQRNEIYKVHKNGGASEVVTLPAGGHGKLYGIVSVLGQCLHMSNKCAVNNGNCKHLCLPNNIGGRICQCPDNASPGCNNRAVVTNEWWR